ncbi:MAG: large conductance mechanosensitive channel protein MscL [Anaerolineales bacterium]
MWEEFKEFIQRGNVIDMAVGIAVGTAFKSVVTSLVNDLIMPPISLVLGTADFTNLFIVLRRGKEAGPYVTLQAAGEAGAVTLNYGLFVNTVVSFFIIAFAVFLLIKAVNRAMPAPEAEPEPAPTTKKCPYCQTDIPIEAVRCPNCTSELEAA